MKIKEIKALKQKTVAELTKELTVKRQEEKKLKLDRKVKQIKNTRMMKNLKDDIARILTVIREMEIKKIKEKK